MMIYDSGCLIFGALRIRLGCRGPGNEVKLVQVEVGKMFCGETSRTGTFGTELFGSEVSIPLLMFALGGCMQPHVSCYGVTGPSSCQVVLCTEIQCLSNVSMSFSLHRDSRANSCQRAVTRAVPQLGWTCGVLTAFGMFAILVQAEKRKQKNRKHETVHETVHVCHTCHSTCRTTGTTVAQVDQRLAAGDA